MTDNVPALWQPSKFEGTDMLPVSNRTALTQRSDLVGRDNVSVEDMTLPTLSLLASLSGAVTSGVDGAKPGLLYLSSTQEIFEPPLRALLIYHFKSRALFPKPDTDPRYNGLDVCLSRDGKQGTVYGRCTDCDYKEWVGKQKPLCTLSNNFVAMTPKGSALIRFSGSSNNRSVRNAITSWISSPKNLFEHPAIINVEVGHKALAGGRQAPYHYLTLLWEQRERVPDEVQQAARALYDEIDTAFKANKMGADDESKSVPEDHIPF